ncbi:MAG: T9SS type A sorting domain-containing protein, partial [Bacteroidota bacterium]
GTCTPLVTLPNTTNFESGIGDWSQATNDDMDWTVQSGSTPTSYTGPSGGYNSSAKYAFTEATNNSGKTAILLSPCFDLSAVNEPFISFAYHMYGGSMGTLKLEISTNGGTTWTTLWTRIGHQGTTWRSAVVYLTAYQTNIVKFRFIGMVAGNTSDMGLDLITVSTASLLPSGFDQAEMPETELVPEMTLSLSPNPARQEMNVRFDASMEQECQLFVTDQAGKIMREELVNISEGENNHLLNVEDLPAGMYFLLLRAGENRITEKFVVLK